MVIIYNFITTRLDKHNKLDYEFNFENGNLMNEPIRENSLNKALNKFNQLTNFKPIYKIEIKKYNK
jgi:hypothetical protein